MIDSAVWKYVIRVSFRRGRNRDPISLKKVSSLKPLEQIVLKKARVKSPPNPSTR